MAITITVPALPGSGTNPRIYTIEDVEAYLKVWLELLTAQLGALAEKNQIAIGDVPLGELDLNRLSEYGAAKIIGTPADQVGTASPTVLSAGDVRTILNVADGATANQTDAHLLNLANATGTLAAARLGLHSITADKLIEIGQSTILGRAAAAGTGDVGVLSAADVRTILNVSSGATANETDAYLLDLANATGTLAAARIAAGSLGLSKLADLAEARIMGRAAGAGSGVPTALTAAQIKAILSLVAADISDLGALATKSTVAEGDIGTAAVTAAKIPANELPLAKLNTLAPGLVLGRALNSSEGDVVALNEAQLKVILALAVADISGLQTALDGKATTAQGAKADTALQTADFNDHKADADQHPISGIVGLQTALDGKGRASDVAQARASAQVDNAIEIGQAVTLDGFEAKISTRSEDGYIAWIEDDHGRQHFAPGLQREPGMAHHVATYGDNDIAFPWSVITEDNDVAIALDENANVWGGGARLYLDGAQAVEATKHERVAWSAGPLSVVRQEDGGERAVNVHAVPGSPDAYILIKYGQSNSTGDQSWPLHVEDKEQGVFGFVGGPLTWDANDFGAFDQSDAAYAADSAARPSGRFRLSTLKEISNDGRNGTTGLLQLGKAFRRRLMGGTWLSSVGLDLNGPAVFGFNSGRGGMYARQLSPERLKVNSEVIGMYDNLLDDIQRAYDELRAAGYLKVHVLGVFAEQGEDEGGGTLEPGGPANDYATFSTAWKSSWEQIIDGVDAKAKAVTGQEEDVILFWGLTKNVWSGAAAQEMAAERDDVVVVGPTHWAQSAKNLGYGVSGTRGAAVHMTGAAQRALAEKEAAAAAAYIRGEGWRNLKLIRAYRVSDTEIRLALAVPVPPLRVCDVLAPLENYGLYLRSGVAYASGSVIPISAVSIDHGRNELVVTTSGITAGADFQISGGERAVIGVSSGTVHSVADGPTTSYDGYSYATKDVIFNGDLRDEFTAALREGTIQIKQSGESPVPTAWVRELVYDAVNTRTTLRGIASEFTNTFSADVVVQMERPQPGTTICDSDPQISDVKFDYGPRAGQRIPIPNYLAPFRVTVET